MATFFVVRDIKPCRVYFTVVSDSYKLSLQEVLLFPTERHKGVYRGVQITSELVLDQARHADVFRPDHR